MKITYIHDKTLEVRLQHSTEDTTKWDLCFSLPDVKIPAVAYLGFTAETGELSDNHDIISVNARNIVVSDSAKSTGPQNQGGKSSRGQKGDRSSGGWGWFFFKFLLFGMVVAGGYVGFTAWRANQRGRSRF
jgi:mannose-binding lectin 2